MIQNISGLFPVLCVMWDGNFLNYTSVMPDSFSPFDVDLYSILVIRQFQIKWKVFQFPVSTFG